MGGRAEVERYWKMISGTKVMNSLGMYIKKEGLSGCYTYWAHTLNEEAADFTMSLDVNAGVFVIDMHRCPSKGMLLGMNHLVPYPSYCDHCPALYKPVVEALGYSYESEIDPDEASCKIVIKNQKK
jgi:hypothetical protein